MQPSSTPAWVVAPDSGSFATTRLGFRPIFAPAGISSFILAVSIRDIVISFALLPYIM